MATDQVAERTRTSMELVTCAVKLRFVSSIALGFGLAMLAGCASTAYERFPNSRAAVFTTRPGPMSWVDEHRLLFSVGGISIYTSRHCGQPDIPCVTNPSIFLFDTENGATSKIAESAELVCAMGNEFAFVRGGQFFVATLDTPSAAVSAGVKDLVRWEGCRPELVQKGAGSGYTTGPIYSQSLKYYEFKDAYLDHAYGQNGQPNKLIWRYRANRPPEIVSLPIGPWNNLTRTTDAYFAARTGLVVLMPRSNYWVQGESYKRLFGGYINSPIYVSKSGCRIAFWGQVEPDASRPYAADVC